jgi:hypothetical protein
MASRIEARAMRYSNKKSQRLRSIKALSTKGTQFSSGTSHQVYANFIHEVAERLDLIASVTSGKLSISEMLAQEICYLQLRMICECIALSCLVAHGDISDITLDEFWNKYKADDIIKRLSELHIEFFPKPKLFTFIAPNTLYPVGEVRIEDKLSPPSLTRSELLSLYGRCGEFLHRSRFRSIEDRPPYKSVTLQPIVEWTGKIVSLLQTHMIFSKNNNKSLLVIARSSDHGNQPVVMFAEAPKQSDPIPS